MGECPAWYPLLLAADRLRCSPWELHDPPEHRDVWRKLALGALEAEQHKRDVELQRLRRQR